MSCAESFPLTFHQFQSDLTFSNRYREEGIEAANDSGGGCLRGAVKEITVPNRCGPTAQLAKGEVF